MSLFKTEAGITRSHELPPLLSSLAQAALVFGCLPNLGFWIATALVDIGRPIFNVDYFLSALLFAFGWRRSGVIVLSLLMMIDVLNLIGQIWPFMRLQDLVYLAGQLPRAAPAYQGAVVAAAFCLIVVVACHARFGARPGKEGALVLFNIAILAYGIHVYAAPDVEERVWRLTGGKLIDSQGLDFINLRLSGFAATAMMDGEPLKQVGYKGKTKVWLDTPPETLSPKLLLIVAESWGAVQNEALSAAIIAPLTALGSRLAWSEFGEMPFTGATVAGELRELCGLWPNHFNLKAQESGFENCFVHRLREQGYRTAAVHGAGGLMYDRAYWYPRAGFDEVMFSETRPWDTRCYSFPGICDREIADEYLDTAFAADEKRFVYWLTLNSHSIYDERDLRARLIDCSAFDIEPDSEMCRMVNLHAQFFSDLARVLQQPTFDGVEAIIVGDHQPPMLGAEAKRRHIKEDTVSWAHFKIGEAHTGTAIAARK